MVLLCCVAVVLGKHIDKKSEKQTEDVEEVKKTEKRGLYDIGDYGHYHAHETHYPHFDAGWNHGVSLHRFSMKNKFENYFID